MENDLGDRYDIEEEERKRMIEIKIDDEIYTWVDIVKGKEDWAKELEEEFKEDD